MKPIVTILCIALLSSCGLVRNLDRTAERTDLLRSGGPVLDSEKHAETMGHLRRYLPGQEKATNPSPITKTEDLLVTRNVVFADIDRQCDAYIDAIFWGARTGDTVSTSLGLIGTSTATILAATGAGTTAIAVTAAAFGLSTALVDSYYKTFLYQLEPSGVVGIAKDARTAFRSSPVFVDPTDEGMLLAQVQGYIRQCSPPKLEALINDAIKSGKVVPVTEDPATPLSKEEMQTLTKLLADKNLDFGEVQQLTALLDRFNDAGVAAATPPEAETITSAASDGDGGGGDSRQTVQANRSVPDTKIE